MKLTRLCRTLITCSSVFAPLALTVTAQAAELEGYATLNGGTTGGAGGTVVYATTGTEINEAMCNRAAKDTPLIIYVSGTINHKNTKKVKGSCDTTDNEIQFKNVSNISLIGTDSAALFDEIGIHIREASNIIIQNIHVRNVKKSGSPLSNGGDAIGLEENVHNIWIDHNELEASGGEKDGYDSLLDMKAGIKYVTVSYNYFHNSGRGGLIGSSDSDDKNNYITFHHNFYKCIDSRMPLLRHATAHAYNNYYLDVLKSVMNPRAGGQIKAENNYFEDVKNPIGTFYTSKTGYWDISGNTFDQVVWNDASGTPAGPNPTSTTAISIPYEYTLHSASCVKNTVTSVAGDQKNLAIIDQDCQIKDPSDSGTTPEPEPEPEPAEPSIDLQLSLLDNVSVQMHWTIKNADIAKLEVYRDTDSDQAGRTKLATLDTAATSYTDTTALAGTTYYYWVKVHQTDDSLINSDPIQIDIPADSNKAPCIDISAEPEDNGILLSWDVYNMDVKEYQLYRSLGPTPKGQVRITLLETSNNSYLDTNVSEGTTYYYWLKITNTNDDTFMTDAISVTVPVVSTDIGSDANNSDTNADTAKNDGNSKGNSSDNTGNSGAGTDAGTDSLGRNSDLSSSHDQNTSETGTDSSETSNPETEENTETEEKTEITIGSFGEFGFILSLLLSLPVLRRKK